LDAPALSFEEETLSYGAVQQRIERLSAVLAAGGVRSGERVAYLGFNHSIVPIALFAAARIGAIFVPLNFRLSGPEVDAVIKDADVHTLIIDAHSAALPEVKQRQLPCKRYLELTTSSTSEASLMALMETEMPLPPAVSGPPGDVVMLMYTSGTMGQPKGVTMTNRNIWVSNLNTILVTDLTSKDVTLICAPLFHAAGLCLMLLPNLMVGAHVILQRSFDAASLLLELERHRVTTTMLVPAMMLFASQQSSFVSTDLSSMRLIVAGGAPVPESLLQLYGARGIPVSQCYGMTESTSVVTALETSKAIKKLGSCGRVAPLNDVRLVDNSGLTVERPNQRGEIWLRGGNVTRGYWNRPEETASAFSDGWFRTGDIAYFDAEGFLYICDRLKDMIISGGENVYPAEVEGVLSTHPAIAEVAVIGAPDPRWGERVVVVAALKSGASLHFDELLAFATERLARYKLPSALHIVDSMPRNATGKLQKTELRKRFAVPT